MYYNVWFYIVNINKHVKVIAKHFENIKYDVAINDNTKQEINKVGMNIQIHVLKVLYNYLFIMTWWALYLAIQISIY